MRSVDDAQSGRTTNRHLVRTSALALDGGVPVRTVPLPSWPHYAPDEVERVRDVLESGKVNYWTGKEGRAFESEFASHVGMPYCVALSNGTVALELALLCMRIGPGDHVIVPSKTFIATASCVVSRGAVPVVADVDPESQDISVETIEKAVTPQTRAIIVVHLAGWPCEMDPILEFAKARKIRVIEDCAQAHGAEYRGKKIGALGDASTFSFCQDKIITTAGEGGALLLRDKALWEKAWSYKDHGKDFAKASAPPSGSGFRFIHESFGTNWRMTEIQAAIGRIQLGKLSNWVGVRRAHAADLTGGLRKIPGIRVSDPPTHMKHSYYQYYFRVDVSHLRTGWTRDRILEAITREGVPCKTGGCSEIYREKAFSTIGIQPKDRLPNAHALSEESLMLPVHPTLSPEDVDDMIEAVRKVMAVACRDV
jgi:dTDP-4-amino-4,6-dideoxygalactose transaminase